MELLRQDPLTATPKLIQLIFLALPFTSFFKDKNRSFVERNKRKISDAFLNNPNFSMITKKIASLKTADELVSLLEGAGEILTKICQ